MGSHLPELPVGLANITYGVGGLICAITVLAKLSRVPNLDRFPAVGSNNWLHSWWAGFKYLGNAQHVIQEGYEKYESAPFKIAEPYHWTVILSKREHLEKLARAPDDELSFLESINDQFQLEHTLGPEVYHNPYHITVFRSHVTRNVEVLHPEIREEIITSFAEILDLKRNEWKSVPAAGVIKTAVCRTSNRLFVGLPLCRNSDWIDLSIQWIDEFIKGGFVVGLFPECMRSLAARFLTNVPHIVARGVKFLGPIIEERQKYLNEYGMDWDDKPNDLLSWLMNVAKDQQLTAKRLTAHVLIVNFAAIHSISNAFTQVLFYLAANPQYIQPLREEVEDIVETNGWSKPALAQMRKVDSFLKECQRIEGANIVSLSRKALKDFTFSDGTFIPKGTSVAAAARPLHHDKRVYANPDVFEPFRFVRMAEEDASGLKHQFASTTTEYLAFGYGRHACPGRFFSSNIMKSLLAHIVVTYDVKLEDNMTRPLSLHIGTSIMADPRAKVMFRNRVD